MESDKTVPACLSATQGRNRLISALLLAAGKNSMSLHTFDIDSVRLDLDELRLIMLCFHSYASNGPLCTR